MGEKKGKKRREETTRVPTANIAAATKRAKPEAVAGVLLARPRPLISHNCSVFSVMGSPFLYGTQLQSWFTRSAETSWHLYKWTLTTLCALISAQFSLVPSSFFAAITSIHFSEPFTLM